MLCGTERKRGLGSASVNCHISIMTITKFGHACFLVGEKGTNILFDPGAYSKGQNNLRNIDLVLITHEHHDHLDINSLKIILANNIRAEVISNAMVADILDKENIKCIALKDGQIYTHKNIPIEAFDQAHAFIYDSSPKVENTGFLVADKLFFPGDAFIDPTRGIDLLALPVAAPWMKTSEAIEYARKLKPRICFPAHEGMLLSPDSVNFTMEKALAESRIRYISAEIGKQFEV